jgi:death on curing protein
LGAFFIPCVFWGISFAASQEETYLLFYDLAAGKITEDELTVWFEKNFAPAAG